MSPVNRSRHGDPDYEAITGEKPMRLPGDPGGDIDWVCQQCDQPQHGRPEHGCPACGAGRPGHKAEGKQPTYEELQRGTGTMTVEPNPQTGSIAARSTLPVLNLADRLGKVAGLTQESLRQIIREELSEALTPPAPKFSDKERLAILEGLGMVVSVLETPDAIDVQQAALLPTVDEIKALTARLQED